MTTVACVLKTGGIYDAGHVARLRHQVREHAPGAPFVCLTDDPRVPADVARRLEHGWPGWFSKLEIFRVPGPVLYLDLDVTVTGDLSPLLDAARCHDLVMCRGFWGVDDPAHVNSSVMAWSGDAGHLYRDFAAKPEMHMRAYSRREKWGDQVFIYDHHGDPLALWQQLLPGMVLSYKRDLLDGKSPQDMRVCVSHGVPKPWDSQGADQWLAKRGISAKRAACPGGVAAHVG